MHPTHVHADAITLLIGGAALIFELAILKGIALEMLSRYPDSAAWQAFAYIVGAVPPNVAA